MKHVNDTSDMCPECTGSGMSCGEACHLCWGSGKYIGNSRMLVTKPTYKEQLDWLDMVQVTFPEASEMIKAIKENVIAVRNYEAAIGKELEPVGKDIDQAFEDLVTFGEGEVIIPQKPIVTKEQLALEVIKTLDNDALTTESLNEIQKAIDDSLNKILPEQFNMVMSLVELKPDEDPFFPRVGFNPREQLLLENRIKQLQGELQAQLSLKKPFRSQQAIDHCHKSINNLKKWKSQSS